MFSIRYLYQFVNIIDIYIIINKLSYIYTFIEVIMDITKEIIGKKIKQIRIEKGFSQEKLSEKIDISPRQMCTIENGNSYPSIETFVKISKILEIDINNFFNITPGKNNKLREEIYTLLQISSEKELYLIKDLIIAVYNNRK